MRSGQRRLGDCKVCAHPGAETIDAMLLNGTDYSIIATKMRQSHTEAPVLTKTNLSRHKTNHLLSKPITIESEDGQQQVYLTGAALAKSITIPKENIPEGVSVSDSLKVIISAGIWNIMQNPAIVTPQVLIQALDQARKLGVGSSEGDEFGAAWAALGGEKAKVTRSTKRTRRVTVEEQISATEATAQAASAPEVIDVTALPEEWSADDLKQLEEPTK